VSTRREEVDRQKKRRRTQTLLETRKQKLLLPKLMMFLGNLEKDSHLQFKRPEGPERGIRCTVLPKQLRGSRVDTTEDELEERRRMQKGGGDFYFCGGGREG